MSIPSILTKNRHRLLLLGIVAVAAALRLYRLSDESLWYDEWVSYQFLNAPSLGSFLAGERSLDPPMLPVYFALQYYWAHWIGNSVATVRLFSIATGLLTIILMYVFGKAVSGRNAGLIAALCLALSKPHIYYSLQIRMYSLLLLLAALSLYTLWLALYAAEDKRLWWWGGHIVCNILMQGTHLFAAMLLVAEGFYLVLRFWRRPQIPFLWGLAHIPVLLLLGLWYYFLDHSALQVAAKWIAPPPIGRLLEAFLLVFPGGKAGYLDPMLHLWLSLPLDLPLGLLCLGLALWADVSSRWNQSRRSEGLTDEHRSEACKLLRWAFIVPPCALFGISHVIRPCFLERYVLYSQIPLFLLVGIGVASLSNKSVRTVCACGLVALYGYHITGLKRPLLMDWRTVAEVLGSRLTKNDVVVLPNNTLEQVPLRFYSRTLVEEQCRAVNGVDNQIQEVREALKQGHTVWALLYDSASYPLSVFEARMRAEHIPLEKVAVVPGYFQIHIYRIGGVVRASGPNAQRGNSAGFSGPNTDCVSWVQRVRMSPSEGPSSPPCTL